MSPSSEPTVPAGEKVEDAVDDVISGASPLEEDTADPPVDDDVDRSGDTALEAGDSFTG